MIIDKMFLSNLGGLILSTRATDILSKYRGRYLGTERGKTTNRLTTLAKMAGIEPTLDNSKRTRDSLITARAFSLSVVCTT